MNRICIALLAAGLLLVPASRQAAAQGDTAQAGEKKTAAKQTAAAPRKPSARSVRRRARQPAAKAPAARTVRKQAPRPKAATAHHSSGSKSTKARVSSKRKRHLSARQQRARLHLEPDRVQEIQRALNQAGYLNAEATGRWDDQTRDAMRRFQADHGFPATGLPEAKSLMKLGLGPHPLPPDLDPGVTAQANASATTDSSTSPPPSPQPPDAGSPPRQR